MMIMGCDHSDGGGNGRKGQDDGNEEGGDNRTFLIVEATSRYIEASSLPAPLRRPFRPPPQTYGYQYLFALNNLEAVGLLKKREKGWVGSVESGSPWPSLRRALRLVNDSVDVRAPDDIAYVSSG